MISTCKVDGCVRRARWAVASYVGERIKSMVMCDEHFGMNPDHRD